MDKIGFGILGAGMISGIHADALRKSAKGKMLCKNPGERDIFDILYFASAED